MLADLQTLAERKGFVTGLRMTYKGTAQQHGALADARQGHRRIIKSPRQRRVSSRCPVRRRRRRHAAETGATVAVTTDRGPRPMAPTCSSPTPGPPWGRRRRSGPDRSVRPTRSTATSSLADSEVPLCCTAFRPIAATDRQGRSTVTAWSGTERRTGCTLRRRATGAG